jgi:cytoskeletal protein RodZ
MSILSIGQTLKEARQKKSVTLEDVHSKIKIHPRVLQLLEENKFDKLPSPLFVKSFLKSYAEFLEVDPSGLLNIYEKEGRKDPEQVLFIKPPELRDKNKEPGSERWVAVTGLAVALILAAVALFFVGNLLAGKIAEWKAAADNAPKREVTVKKKAKPKTEKAAPKKPNEWLRSTELGNYPNIPDRTPLELNVKAVDNVWMRVTCDGKVLFQSILKRGQSETWTGKQSIEIWTGNSSNMVLSINGYMMGSPGKGVVKKMIVNHDGVKIPA